MVFQITNMLGLLSFLSVLILIFFYLMRPKPLKKVIPSIIFLESSKKKKNMTSFFKRFVKDWIFLLQLIILIVLCLATLGITVEMMIQRAEKDITLVIDASASSKSYDEGNILFDKYIEIAKQNIGARNTIILIKNTPEVLASNTNPLNALRIISSARPSDSLSNIWDSMMLASQISNGKIILISDFSDTNSRNILTAKQLLEARGFDVELISPKSRNIPNIGIINYRISGDRAVIDIKNYNDYEDYAVLNGIPMNFKQNSIEQAEIILYPGVNTIKIEANDGFQTDNVLNIIIPKESEKNVLFITNKRRNNLYSALTSVSFLDVRIAEPPIIPDGDYDLYVLSDVDYENMLPGTLDKLMQKVHDGSSIIITAQENLHSSDFLPINIVSEKLQEISIYNSRISKFEDFNFGLSSKYIEATIKSNSSVIIAEANDRKNSPVITFSNYGSGKVLYYGIYDQHNSFRLSTQYPLFWIASLDLLISKEDYTDSNKKIGEIIYGDIRDPDNKRIKGYISTEKTGIYKVDGKEVVVNLLNSLESDLNKDFKSDDIKKNLEKTKVIQDFPLISVLLIFSMILIFLELYLIKKRGDL